MEGPDMSLTKAQQDFFRDSRVRYTNGELITVYHGAKTSDFDAFQYSPDRQTGTDFGEAYYFTSDYTKAKGYSYDIEKDPRVKQYKEQKERLLNVEENLIKLSKEKENLIKEKYLLHQGLCAGDGIHFHDHDILHVLVPAVNHRAVGLHLCGEFHAVTFIIAKQLVAHIPDGVIADAGGG